MQLEVSVKEWSSNTSHPGNLGLRHLWMVSILLLGLVLKLSLSLRGDEGGNREAEKENSAAYYTVFCVCMCMFYLWWQIWKSFCILQLTDRCSSAHMNNTSFKIVCHCYTVLMIYYFSISSFTLFPLEYVRNLAGLFQIHISVCSVKVSAWF